MGIEIKLEIRNANPQPGKHISRTMHLLATSTPASRNEVRILVYGQSISMQAWWLAVKRHLMRTYPHARIVVENLAIGGFSTQRLVRCVEHDVLSVYPDLILFHDYGPEDAYEEIVRTMRRVCAAEIAVQNDHLAATQDDEWHNRHSHTWLPELCRRYALELVDVRGNWRRYLERERLAPDALLRDNVHLGDAGNRLMAEIVKAHLVYDPVYGSDPQGLVQHIELSEEQRRSGQLEIPFTGNRVDVVTERGLRPLHLRVHIDGRPPQTFPSTYVAERLWIDRPWPPCVGIPVRIDLGEQRETDEWTMHVRRVIGDGQEVHFDLHSGKHGFEGSGTSTADFWSDRIRIEQENWFIRETPTFFDVLPAVEEGQRITWAVRQLACDELRLASTEGRTLTIAQGLPGGPHKLQIVDMGERPLPVTALVVYKPPLAG